MKTVILYASVHHSNTKKVVEAMREELSADLMDLMEEPMPDVSGYDIVGLASGSYFGKMHQRIQDFAIKGGLRSGQRAFLVCTCGMRYKDHTASVKRILRKRDIEVENSFQCRGYDTYGVFGKIGGIAKGRPDRRDLERAREFAKRLNVL